MDKKLRDVQVGDKDERDKGAIKGQREEHRVQGSSSSLGAGGWQCWPRLDPTCTWPQMISLPVRKHIGPRAHGPTRLLSFRELTIPLYRDRPPYPTLRDPAWAQKSWSTRPKTPRVPPQAPRWGSQVEHDACQAPSIPVQCVDVFYVPKESADLFWLQQPRCVNDLQKVILHRDRRQSTAPPGKILSPQPHLISVLHFTAVTRFHRHHLPYWVG